MERKRTESLYAEGLSRFFFKEIDADIFCLQETKLQEGQIALDLPDIISIGITQRKRAIPALQFLQRKSPYR